MKYLHKNLKIINKKKITKTTKEQMNNLLDVIKQYKETLSL